MTENRLAWIASSLHKRAHEIHLLMVIVGGLFTYYLLVSGIPNILESSPDNANESSVLHINLLSGRLFYGICVVSLTLSVPLFLDVVFDIIGNLFFANNSRSNEVAGEKELLTVFEKFIINVAFIAVPIVPFLPSSCYDKIGMIYVCCDRFQLMVAAGTLFASMYRFDHRFFPLRTITAMILIWIVASVSGTFVSNDSEASVNVAASLFVFNQFLSWATGVFFCLLLIRWMVVVCFYSRLSRTWLGRMLIPTGFETAKTESAQDASPLVAVRRRQVFFCVVHCFIILLWLVLRAYLRFKTPFPRTRDDYNLFLQIIPFMCFQTCLLIFDMRRVKYEVVISLLALIDAKKNYVRYISHELRTPLNAAINGIQMLEIGLQKSTNPVDIQRHETLEDITSCCTAAVDILNDLLTFEK